METIAIIGGMYGDEGKGLITDYLCGHLVDKSKSLAVVRFQGGAQSGHTVVTPSGRRHIFSHFGSGTLLGVPTILSSKFVCNPYIFLTEYKELRNFNPIVYIDPECYITTPYDVMYNRKLERVRGDKRHGSVGIGFGQTIEREEVGKISLRYKDIHNSESFLLNKLHEIQSWYEETYSYFREKVDHRLAVIHMFKFRALTYSFTRLFTDNLIFEGGQGLGLDMEYGEFPHVTRSRTGIHHALEFCDNYNIRLDGVIYATRSYTTRHGAGPLNMEDNNYYHHINDETNKENEFQGKLRVAPFDFDLFSHLTGKDTSHDRFTGIAKYAMTCVDQIPKTKKSKMRIAGVLLEMEYYEYENYINGTFDLVSYGPTRNDVIDNG